jgi:hypothetical protein
LSNASAWNENDGCFNYITFYNNIIDYFEIDLGPENHSKVCHALGTVGKGECIVTCCPWLLIDARTVNNIDI